MTLWQDLQRLQNTLTYFQELEDFARTLKNNGHNEKQKPKLENIIRQVKKCSNEVSILFDLYEQYPSEIVLKKVKK